MSNAISTYRVSTWDHEVDNWETQFQGVTKWGLREKIKELYEGGWSELSVQVCNEQSFPLRANHLKVNGIYLRLPDRLLDAYKKLCEDFDETVNCFTVELIEESISQSTNRCKSE